MEERMGEFNFQLVIPCTNARNCDRRRCKMWHEDDPPERRKQLEEETIRKIRSIRGNKRGGMGFKGVNRRISEREEKNNKKVGNKRKAETNSEKYYTVTGLENLRNTCYLNTIVQIMGSCKVFAERLMREAETKPCEGSLTHELACTMKTLQNGEFKTIQPTKLKEKIGEIAEDFRNNRQHDAHELLIKLLDQIHEETKDNLNNSIVKKTFVGTTVSTVRCTNCKGEKMETGGIQCHQPKYSRKGKHHTPRLYQPHGERGNIGMEM